MVICAVLTLSCVSTRNHIRSTTTVYIVKHITNKDVSVLINAIKIKVYMKSQGLSVILIFYKGVLLFSSDLISSHIRNDLLSINHGKTTRMCVF